MTERYKSDESKVIDLKTNRESTEVREKLENTEKGKRSRITLALITVILLLTLCVISGSLVAFLRNLSILIVAFYCVYLARHLSFAWAALAVRWRPSELATDLPAKLPRVTILVAAHNEDRVIERLVRALMNLNYPEDLREVIVVDDASTDSTPAILERLRKEHPSLRVIRRTEEERRKTPGKPAALNRGLLEATGEIVVVYDADHIPDRNAVMRLVMHFADPKVGAVMGRCKIMNRDENILTKLVYIDYLSGYLVNEYGREAFYSLPAFGGSNCAIRRSILETYGGFNERSVTEDTDITTRLILDGYRVVYDREALSLEEAPNRLTRFIRQRYRWAFGHQHVFYDYWLETLKSRHLRMVDKIELLLFLFLYHAPVVMFVGLILGFLWALGLFIPTSVPLAWLLWTLLFLGPFLEIGAGVIAEWREGEEPPNPGYLILFIPLFFISIFICTKAFIDGLVYPLIGRKYIWVKTPRREI